MFFWKHVMTGLSSPHSCRGSGRRRR
jgi:hypothetical protein